MECAVPTLFVTVTNLHDVTTTTKMALVKEMVRQTKWLSIFTMHCMGRPMKCRRCRTGDSCKARLVMVRLALS